MKRYLAPVAVVAALFASSAMAQVDSKSYPGAACNPYKSADQGRLRADSVGVTNINGSMSAKVTCPLVRDQFFNFTGAAFAAVSVNNPGSDNLQCRMFARQVFGGAPLSGFWKTDNVDFPADTILDMTMALTDFIGTYSMECTLPAGAKIYGYGMVENPGVP